jgi:hypothetical protein
MKHYPEIEKWTDKKLSDAMGMLNIIFFENGFLIEQEPASERNALAKELHEKHQECIEEFNRRIRAKKYENNSASLS